jgi:molybdopterin converting factor small subunit
LGIKIEIPNHLLHFVDNNKIVEVKGRTIKECLMNLAWKYPAMMPEMFDTNGELGVIVLHGDVPIDDITLNDPVKDGDTIGLFPIIVGG